MPAELAVIVPTFRERENLEPVVTRLRALLDGWDWEIIFVDDDSQDGSLEEFLRLNAEDARVRFLRRIGRRGLASACIEGMCATGAEILAVMDADLQHDETILPKMVQTLKDDPGIELVVGTRYSGGGGVGDWSRGRQAISKFATWVEKSLLRTSLTDPMSGFFALRRAVFEKSVRRLTGKGFKILLDIVLSCPTPPVVREIPYTFRPRERGESKLDIIVGLEYLYLIAEKLFGKLLPVRFLVYGMVGLSGLLLHLSVLWLTHRLAGIDFAASQWLATGCAMLSNFLVNNLITFRAQRLKGASLLPGAVLYMLICTLGALANVQVAQYLHGAGVPWWGAGAIGALIGAVWNYAVSTQIVWTWFREKFSPGK